MRIDVFTLNNLLRCNKTLKTFTCSDLFKPIIDK